MGRPKPLISVAGHRLLEHVLATVRRSRVDDIVVVLGSDADQICREADLDGAAVVMNPDYATGMSTSIRAGLRAAAEKTGGYLVVLGDQPFVSSSTLDALISEWSTGRGRIFIPTFRSVRGNPVLIDRSLADAIDAITGDQGCRAIFPRHTNSIVEVPVEDPGVLVDLDTEDQLSRVAASMERGESLESVAAEVASKRIHAHSQTAAQSARPRLRGVLDILGLAHELRSRNEAFALATVVRTVRPTSGKPGNKAIVRPSKELVGWIGGSCAESVVIAEALAAIRDGRPRVLRLAREIGRSPVPEGVVEYVMECHSGGAMDIYIEPNLPRPQLVIVGNSPVATALVHLGRMMDYRVVAVAQGADPESFPDADLVVSSTKEIGTHAIPGSFAVVATMGKYDATALRELAASNAAYIGLVASRSRARVVMDELRKAGLPAEVVNRIRSPAGLDIAAETSEEIAVSIIAEITQSRRASPTVRELPLAPAVPGTGVTPAIDPVCGMEVDPATGLTASYKDRTYHFCSEGCRARFQESPETFLP